MKLVGLLNAYNEESMILNSLLNKYDYFDQLIISDNCYKKPGRSTDGTSKIIDDFIKNYDRENKLKKVDLSKFKYSSITSQNEAAIKTLMMDQSSLVDGDWVMICDADEFYFEEQLKELNPILSSINKPFVRVQAHCFFYNKSLYARETHGRIFQYKKGSYFKGGHNKFHWPTGIIYDKKYEYLMPYEELTMFHMKHVKPLQRQDERYDIYSDGMSNRKKSWLHNVFYVWPKNQELAYKNCKNMFGSDSFDTGSGGKLKEYTGRFPTVLENYNVDLLKELQ